MPIIQPQPYLDFSQWLDANADEVARMAAVSNQQEIKASLREIAKAVGSNWDIMVKILVTLTGNKVLPLFVRNLSCFSEIAKIALRHTEPAFYSLNAAALSDLAKKNPEALKQLFSDVIGAASKSALPDAVDWALFALSNDNVAALAVEKPDLLVSTFNQITEAAGKFSPNVFSAISDKNISALYAQDPSIILNTYSQVAAVSNREAAAIFISALKKQKLFDIFKANPEKVVKAFTDPAKVCGKNSPAIFYLLANQRIAYMLEMNPQSLLIGLNAFVETADTAAELAIPFVFDERVQNKFLDDAAELGTSFKSVIDAAGEGAQNAITLLKKEGLLDKFLENPEPIIKLFSSVSNASGTHANAAFYLLTNPTIYSMLQTDSDDMVQKLKSLSASCGDSTSTIFTFLVKEKIAEHFDKMVEFFSTLGAETARGEGTFEMFANAKFATGFEDWPEETMENLKMIADEAGPYARDIFKLLAKDRLAQAITELVSGKHLATCLTNLVNNSGKDTPMILSLFENDEFTKQFINDPYRQVQIISHLRSFAGSDLTKGIEVLKDPEIARVFAEDPSVLVTTRFRSYVNNATAIPDITAWDSMDAILRDQKVKAIFIDYVKQEFHGGDTQLLKNDLIPALRAFVIRSRSLGSGNQRSASADTKRCIKCDSSIPASARFCSECGAPQE